VEEATPKKHYAGRRRRKKRGNDPNRDGPSTERKQENPPFVEQRGGGRCSGPKPAAGAKPKPKKKIMGECIFGFA